MRRALATRTIGIESAFRTCRKPLNRIAARITRDVTTAEDIVQQGFLRTWECELALPAEGMQRWLVTVVKRLAIDEVRKNNVRARTADVLRFLEKLASESGPSHMFDGYQYQAALANLDTETLALVQLWCAGASYASIAQTLEVPVGTVATAHARQRAVAQYARAALMNRCARVSSPSPRGLFISALSVALAQSVRADRFVCSV